MDYSELNHSSWSSYLLRFKDLLRPEGVSPLASAEESVESARGEESAKIALAIITNTLPNLVFDGYRQWYSEDDEWVLTNLGQVLTLDEEHQILSGLSEGTPQSLGQVLRYIAEERIGTWQKTARDEFAQPGEAAEAQELTGLPNTASWEASRTPGTYYYTYFGDRYLYSDLAEGPISEWETMPVRDELAAANAQPWGSGGWVYTPTGDPELYGGPFVFASDSDGPWMTEDQASEQLRESESPSPFDRVEPVPGQAGWLQAYDAGEGVWKYAQAVDGRPPIDLASWIAIDTFRSDNSEYFAGPGWSASGWVPYEDPSQAERPGDLEEEAATDRPGDPGEEAVPEEQREAVAARIRDSVVLPAIEQLKRAHPGLTDERARRLVVAATSQALQGGEE